MPDLIATEADVTALINSDHTNEAMLRSMGKVVEADQLASTRATRMQAMRTGLGLAEPKAPDPAVVKAAEIGVSIEAKPGDYSKADLSDFGRDRNLPDERVAAVKTELSGLMASMQIEANSGAYLMQFVAKTGPELKAMSDDARSMWVTDQERDASLMAKHRGTTLDALKANAKAVLSNHPLGKQIADSALLSSPTILVMLHDHSKFVEAHKKSKG